MHEIKFIDEIFKLLKEKITEKKNLLKTTVTVRLSAFSHVSENILHESFKLLLQRENFTNIDLKILPIELQLECKTCKQKTTVTKKIFNCPFCSSTDIDVKLDKEFFVESIELKYI